MRSLFFWLTAVAALLVPATALPQSMSACRAKSELLKLGSDLPIARKAMAEHKHLRIVALGSSTTAGYGVSNPAYAYPMQLRIGLEKALPGIEIEVINRGIGGQDVEEMAARMRADMTPNPPSLVIWQTGTNAAMRHMPIDLFERRLRDGVKLGKSLGADFVLMSLQYAPAVVALPDEEVYERIMAGVATDVGAGLFRRYDIMRAWYDDGMPYAQFVQLDGLHLNDFGQKCIGKLLTLSILGALTGP
ncbi:MAG: SGNH/GDSL hydrolase family protein [Rhodospirillales bacterium]|nr:SGNH/GDSL hydrolase family protein [Rhodospirillales bacterium]